MNLTEDDRAAWAAYEAAGLAAADQYKVLPIAHNHATARTPCTNCRALTMNAGLCRACRAAAS